MNPPAEQLVRDYLNRVSIAARDRLGSSDRQLLLNQTRARIEAQCGDPASAGVAEVRKALAALGDPLAVVEAHAGVAAPRAATVGAVMPAPIHASGSAKDGAGSPEGGTGRRRSRHPVFPFVPRPATSPEPGRDRPGSGDPAKNGALGAAQDASASTAQPGSRRIAEAAGVVAGRLGRFGLSLASIARRHKLEMLAVLLLGVGGVIFPPVWLLGAILVLTSREWDIRDKWIGLALPVLGTIMGTALVLVMGGERGSLVSYAYEAWLGAGRLIRVLAVLSAVYLLWQLRKGRKEPRQPPWNVPHKLDL